MFTLNDYVATLLDLVSQEKDFQKREELIKSWAGLIIRHNRGMELPKVFDILEKEFEEREEKAEIKVKDKEIGEKIRLFFEKKGIASNVEVREDVLGGSSVVYRNTLYDNTLKRKLIELGKELKY